MSGWQLKRLTDPDDPDLAALATLLHEVFADPNTVLGLERLREFVAERTNERVFNAVVATQAERVAGCIVFSYVPASNCGFSECLAVASDLRGAGLGRGLGYARRALRDQQ